MITGCYVSRAIHVDAKLDIADLLAGGSRRHDELAQTTGTHAPFPPSGSAPARRRRRARRGGGWGLRPDADRCLPALRRSRFDARRCVAVRRHHPAAWGDLLYDAQTGEPAFRRVFRTDPFDYMAQHPDEAANFDATMADFITHIAVAVAAAYDFSPFRRIVDVGIGNGALLAGILKATPGAVGRPLPSASGLRARRCAASASPSAAGSSAATSSRRYPPAATPTS